MKEIIAVIRPNRLSKVRDAFRSLPGFPGMSISHIEGCSGHAGAEQKDSLKEELTDFTKKIRIEIISTDEMVEDIARIIHQSAHTGNTGDGVLWVTEVNKFVRLCNESN